MSDGDTAMDETKEPAGVDEKLYSRQLYVMGHEGQRQMAASNVLICGLDGVGVEIAKNVILAGVKSVTLLDDTPASWMDMGAQFYVREADLGQPRAAVSPQRRSREAPGRERRGGDDAQRDEPRARRHGATLPLQGVEGRK